MNELDQRGDSLSERKNLMCDFFFFKPALEKGEVKVGSKVLW